MYNLPFDSSMLPSTVSVVPSRVTLASSPFTPSFADDSTVISASLATVPPVIVCFEPFLIENFPPVALIADEFSEELFISSSDEVPIFIVPPVIVLSEVFRTSFESFIFVVPFVWLNLTFDVVVFDNLLVKFNVPPEFETSPFQVSEPSIVTFPPLTFSEPFSLIVTFVP